MLPNLRDLRALEKVRGKLRGKISIRKPKIPSQFGLRKEKVKRRAGELSSLAIWTGFSQGLGDFQSKTLSSNERRRIVNW
jgi:hypothetical protein